MTIRCHSIATKGPQLGPRAWTLSKQPFILISKVAALPFPLRKHLEQLDPWQASVALSSVPRILAIPGGQRTVQPSTDLYRHYEQGLHQTWCLNSRGAPNIDILASPWLCEIRNVFWLLWTKAMEVVSAQPGNFLKTKRNWMLFNCSEKCWGFTKSGAEVMEDECHIRNISVSSFLKRNCFPPVFISNGAISRMALLLPWRCGLMGLYLREILA